MKRHALRTGEYLAIDPSLVEHDAAGFFLMLGPDAPENEREGTLCIVHVRGALLQFKDQGGDSYEAIVERVKCGLEYDPKPSGILFRISSPGGVVAGLNEAVQKLQRMSKDSGVPFFAYVDEMAASAAYAISCACAGGIFAPPSAVVGSIGTISTMVSCAEADKKDGLDFRLITSGKRKADGHPHAAISDDAIRAETARNAELAAQFFALAGKARGIAPKKLATLEAAIYLGKDAMRVGLVDEVLSLDEAILGLDRTETPPPSPVAPNHGNETDRRAKEPPGTVPLDKGGTRPSSLSQPEPPSGTHEGSPMSVKLAALIKKTEAAISTATDPKERRALQAKLAAYEATRAEMDDGDSDDDDKGDDDKAKKAAEAAKKAAKKAEAAKHRAKAAEHKQKAAEYEDAAKKAEEDDEEEDDEESEEEAAARIAEVHARIEGATPTAVLAPGAAAAIASQAAETRATNARLDKIEKDTEARNLSAMIAEASAQRRITPGEAKTLAKKDAKFVRDFLEMRPKALVATTEENLEQPDNVPGADIPAAARAMVDQGIAALGLTGEAADKYREASFAAHRKASNLNGAGAY